MGKWTRKDKKKDKKKNHVDEDKAHPYGKFNDPSLDAIAANSAVKTYVDGWVNVNESFKPSTCHELVRLYECSTKMMADGSRTVKKETLGDFLITMINEQRTCTGHYQKKPSSTHQQYLNLLRKLEMEGELINVPIEEVNDEHCAKFSDFILYRLNGTNYTNLMKWFKAVHNKAVKQKKNEHIITFDASDAAPVKDTVEIRSLTKKQLETFEAFDLSKLLGHFTPKKALESYEIYRDFAVFMYEMKLRPIDTVKMKYENMKVSVDGVYYIQYVPEKKKNIKKKNKKLPPVQSPMTDKAKDIAEKYRGRSSQGYIFQFGLNEYEWDDADPEQFRKHYSKWNRLLEQINTFLHLLEDDLDFPGLTLYMFRHAAFTIACTEMKRSYFEIAAHGGTSVKMLEEHYVSVGYTEKAQ